MDPVRCLPLAGLLAIALAGCVGGGAHEPIEAVPPSGDVLPHGSLAMPAWAIGDAWTYDFKGEATTYVVTSETATDWILETDSAERAFADLREDISRLGPQRKSDLAGSQGQDRVEFFRWPLEAGKTWTTRWDGQEVEVRVVDVADGVALLEAVLASDAGGVAYRYTYDSGTRWFGELLRFAPDGSEAVALRLASAERNWTGSLVRWRLAEVVHDEGQDGAVASGPFEVLAGTTDLWMEYHFTCTGGGGYTVAVEPLNAGLVGQQGMQDTGPCVQVDWSGPIVAAPHPGTWAFAVDMGGQTAVHDYTLLQRTREDVAFPA